MARPTLSQHRKFHRLVDVLGSRIVARGVLELLWETAYQSGDTYVGTNVDLCQKVGWSDFVKLDDRFVKLDLADLLFKCGQPEGVGFLDREIINNLAVYHIHDLFHHAPDYVWKRKQRELERQQRFTPDSPDRREGSPDRRSADIGRQSAVTDRRAADTDGHMADNGRPPAPAPAPARSPAPAPALRDQATAAAVQPSIDRSPNTHALTRKAASAAPEALLAAWNDITSPPIRKVRGTLPARLKAAAAALLVRSLDEHKVLIRRIEASQFCHGNGEQQWVAGVDWYLRPETQIKIIEGQYDDHPDFVDPRVRDFCEQARLPFEFVSANFARDKFDYRSHEREDGGGVLVFMTRYDVSAVRAAYGSDLEEEAKKRGFVELRWE